MNNNDFDYTIIWRLQGVEILRGGVIPEDKTDIIELRAFNRNKEYRWNEFGERTAPDDVDSINEENVIDEIHKLWGSPPKDSDENTLSYFFNGDITTLTEDRGTVVKVPFKVPDGNHLFIKVRNYLSADEKPFEFLDWRFVEFIPKEAKEAYVR